MSLMFSKGCQHAIRALVYLAERKDGGPLGVKVVSNDLDLPYPYLAKIIQDLARRDLLVSRKGPGGGIYLSRDPTKMSLLEIVEAVDGPHSLKQCVLGLPACNDAFPCPLHTSWIEIRDRALSTLLSANLSALAKTASAP